MLSKVPERRRQRTTSLDRLAPFADDCVMVVIETPWLHRSFAADWRDEAEHTEERTTERWLSLAASSSA